jgi:Ca-activated chloride channel family protein
MSSYYRNLIWWLITSCVLCSQIVLNQAARAETDINPGAGALTLSADGKSDIPATLVKTDVSAQIDGMIATVTYRQRFTNTQDQWVEGIYRFPLGEGSAITEMIMRIGEREIIGKIKEKQKAKKIYEKAKAQGKHAALTEQSRANFFSQSVANIGPGESIEIELKYQEQVVYDNGEFEWRLPTTFTPRYTPNLFIEKKPAENSNEDEAISHTELHTQKTGWHINPDLFADTNAISPPFKRNIKHPLELNISLNSGLNLASISSPYHNIKIKKKAKLHQVSLAPGEGEMNRDFVLQWAPVSDQAPSAAVFTESIGKDVYAMLMLVPPQKNIETLPRDIVFIIDTSGSMQGNSIEQAKTSLMLALDKLSHTDRFNIVEFNSIHRSAFANLKEVNDTSIQKAKNWVNSLSADGGTEMKPALKTGFQHFEKNEKLKQLIFITDGAVGNENDLFNLIYTHAGDIRLFTVAIGSAPNNYFMKKSAEFGRGTYTHIGSSAEVQEKMDTLFNKIEGAVAQNITINWHTDNEQYPKRIGDLYQGEPLVVISKLENPGKQLTASGLTLSEHWQRDITMNESGNAKGLSRLWARKKIEDIENQEISGTLGPESAKKQITELALQHSLLSKFTSFVAVEHKKSRPKNDLLKSENIPNQIAKGQTMIPVSFPKTATASTLYFWIGLLSLLSAGALHLNRGHKHA